MAALSNPKELEVLLDRMFHQNERTQTNVENDAQKPNSENEMYGSATVSSDEQSPFDYATEMHDPASSVLRATKRFKKEGHEPPVIEDERDDAYELGNDDDGDDPFLQNLINVGITPEVRSMAYCDNLPPLPSFLSLSTHVTPSNSNYINNPSITQQHNESYDDFSSSCKL